MYVMLRIRNMKGISEIEDDISNERIRGIETVDEEAMIMPITRGHVLRHHR